MASEQKKSVDIMENYMNELMDAVDKNLSQEEEEKELRTQSASQRVPGATTELKVVQQQAKDWECNLCQKSFANEYNLRRHKRRTHNRRVSINSTKTSSYSKPFSSKIVYEKSSTQVTWKCSFCYTVFEHRILKEIHCCKVSSQKNSISVNCGYCGQIFDADNHEFHVFLNHEAKVTLFN